MILLPKAPKITSKKDNFARFEIESLYPGYGITIGNTLRRVLLSSLSGAAITKVKIKGIQHEFSTIPGVLEDTIDILLNLKQTRFKLFTEEPQKVMLKVKGEKEVKGSDFKLPSQVKIVNGDIHIASLTSKDAELEIEATVEKGLGYVPVERRKKEKLGVGEIALDAIFSPIRKISYHVENMRVGERTDFDRLILDVETDGTLTPEEAFSLASETIIKHFSLFLDTFKEDKETNVQSSDDGSNDDKSQAKDKKEGDSINDDPIEKLDLSTKTLNVLIKNNIKTIGDILEKKEEDILKIEGMGQKGVHDIIDKLKKLGLNLKNR